MNELDYNQLEIQNNNSKEKGKENNYKNIHKTKRRNRIKQKQVNIIK